MQANYVIRPMRREELDIAVDWAALEGWNPGLGDAEVFYTADPGGFWIGLLDGEPIASISAVAYDDAFAFVGFYIVLPEFRGRGFGLAIWQQALARVQGRNIGLDGVPAQQANYERSGFSLAYRHVRYEGRTGPAEQAADIVPLTEEGWPELLAYDRRHFASDRPDFLRRWPALSQRLQAGSIVRRQRRSGARPVHGAGVPDPGRRAAVPGRAGCKRGRR